MFKNNHSKQRHVFVSFQGKTQRNPFPHDSADRIPHPRPPSARTCIVHVSHHSCYLQAKIRRNSQCPAPLRIAARNRWIHFRFARSAAARARSNSTVPPAYASPKTSSLPRRPATETKSKPETKTIRRASSSKKTDSKSPSSPTARPLQTSKKLCSFVLCGHRG